MPREQLQQECSRRVDHLLNEQRCPLSAPEKATVALESELNSKFGKAPPVPPNVLTSFSSVASQRVSSSAAP